MTTTGYTDTFNRTVANGLGTATSGQVYTLNGVATQFSVAPVTASIAIATSGEKYGVVDMQTQNLDITGQVALSAIPATVLATVGFVSKWLTPGNNYYSGVMMVATGGAISLRFSKVIGAGLSTIATVATGLTYVANTFYNLRYQIFWSRSQQTNVMSLKLWAVGATEPGGWMATTTDASLTDYTSGTGVGIYARDESTPGSITARFRSVAARSYSLPMPALTDPMCYDPGVAFPKQTALESLADAADAAMATIDPLVSIANLFPRVRVSNTNLGINTSPGVIVLTYASTEFNTGTDTNLGYDNTSLYLPVGIWIVTFEILLAEGAADFISILGSGNGAPGFDVKMRSNPVQTNDLGAGGTCHTSTSVVSSDPTAPVPFAVTFVPNNTATNYNVRYMALSAIKVSDYFV